MMRSSLREVMDNNLAAPLGASSYPSAAAPLLDRIKGAFGSLLFDRAGNASRPKLLFFVAAADVASVILAWFIGHAMVGSEIQSTVSGLAGVTFIALMTSAMLNSQWSYTIAGLRRLSVQAVKVFASLIAVFLGMSGVAYLLDIRIVPPDLMAAWLIASGIVLCSVRAVAARAVTRLGDMGRLVRRTVIVGGGKDADTLIDALAADPAGQLKILGIFDDRLDGRAREGRADFAHLGTFEKLSDFCRDASVDLLIVTVPPRAEERLLHILRKLFTLQVDVRVSALNSKLRFNSRAYSYIGPVPMLAVMDKPLSDWDRVMKNVEDRVLGGLLLLLAAPVMALVAIALRLDSKGPIFFRQRRYGFNNEMIEVYKFRSMYVDKLDATASRLVTRDDPRVTRVGRFIRRTSLDELPQLFNVLRGQMSLVGPRPHATGARAERDLYEDVVQEYFARHRVKPGVTGWAQVSGWRGETDTHEKLQRRVEHDLYYIDNWSLMFDLYIVAMTPISLISGKNAY